MRFSLPSIKRSAVPPCFRLLPSERLSNQIVEHSSDNIVGGWEEPPNIWLTATKNAFVGWALNFGVRMLLKSALTRLYKRLPHATAVVYLFIAPFNFLGVSCCFIQLRDTHDLGHIWKAFFLYLGVSQVLCHHMNYMHDTLARIPVF